MVNTIPFIKLNLLMATRTTAIFHRWARYFLTWAIVFGFAIGEISIAEATPIQWQLRNTFFTDGGIATGDYLIDMNEAGPVSLLEWSISVDGGDTVTFPPSPLKVPQTTCDG